MTQEWQVDLADWLRYFDPETYEGDLREDTPDPLIPHIIDLYDLTKHNSTIYQIRYVWPHKNYSPKQRWMIVCEAAKVEKSFWK